MHIICENADVVFLIPDKNHDKNSTGYEQYIFTYTTPHSHVQWLRICSSGTGLRNYVATFRLLLHFMAPKKYILNFTLQISSKLNAFRKSLALM